MPLTVRIPIGRESLPFELDFETWRWTAGKALPEGYFPLITELAEKRYELYSDGTFAEVERDGQR
jgi:hypothetical protein